ncbi:MAG: BtpA/SgcQ family protein [Phycisphaerales bacterium]|jgi:membrane complex biogenesis BtpA family protein
MHPLFKSLPQAAVIAMIHVPALPGTPTSRRSVREIADQAAGEARLLAAAGVDALMIENMHDAPYVNAPHGPEITAAMTRAALAVRAAAPKLPLGVQVLSLGTREALAIALASDANFIRAENFVFSHVADEGLMPEAQAGPLLRYRRQIGADHIAILADIQKKHASHALTADLPISELAHAAEFFRADGLIVTGLATGRPASLSDLRSVAGATPLPVLVGSGVAPASVAELAGIARAFIVGSAIKRGGHWARDPDPARVRELTRAVARARR